MLAALVMVASVGSASRSDATPSTCAPANDNTIYSSPYGYDPRAALGLGQSFDPVDATQNHNRCLDAGGEQAIPNTSGPSGISVAIQNNREGFYNSVGVSAAASARYGLASFSASYSNLDQRSFSNYSLNFVVTAYADKGLYEMTNPQLTPAIQDLVDQGRSDLARNRCGSAYVKNVRQKISYSMVYSFENLSSAERNGMAAAFNAAYGGGIGGASGALEAAWNQTRLSLSSRARARVDFIANGGGIAALQLQACLINADLFTLSTVRQCLVDFTTAVANDPGAATATDFYIAPIADFGVVPCFQAGVRNRDEISGDIRIAHEDALATEKMLVDLHDEILLGLAQTTAPSQDVDGAAAAYGQYTVDLQDLYEACQGDEANNYANCRRPAEANPPVLAPPIPSGVIDALYDRTQWSLYRWCLGLRDGIPAADANSPAGRVTAGILGAMGLNPQACPQTLSNASATTLNISGNSAIEVDNTGASFDLTPLGSLPSASTLQFLTVEAVGAWGRCVGGEVDGRIIQDQHCFDTNYATMCITSPPVGNCVLSTRDTINLNALRKLPALRTLRLRGLGITDDDLDGLLGAAPANPFPTLQTLDLGNNAIGHVDHHWPTTLVNLELDNNHLGHDTVVHQTVANTFAPLLSLRRLGLRSQVLIRGQPNLTLVFPQRQGYPCDQWPSGQPDETSAILTTNNAKELFWGLTEALQTQVTAGRTDPSTMGVEYEFRGYAASSFTCSTCNNLVDSISAPPVLTCSPWTQGTIPWCPGQPGAGCLDVPARLAGLW